MNLILPNQQTAEVLRVKIEELRALAHSVMDDVDDLRARRIADVTSGIDMLEEVRRFEIKLIKVALHVAQGHQRRASGLLGLKATTLNAKIKRYAIRF